MHLNVIGCLFVSNLELWQGNINGLIYYSHSLVDKETVKDLLASSSLNKKFPGTLGELKTEPHNR